MIFGGFGVVALALMTKEIAKDFAMLRWPTVPCAIESSKVTQTSKGYAFVVSYRYKLGGKTYVGKTYRENYTDSDSYSEADKIQRHFSVGSARTCFVNPADPADAVLEVQSPWAIAGFSFIPLIFILVGLGGIYFVWFPRRGKAISSGTATSATGPISERATSASGVRIGYALFGLFFLLGAGMAIGWTIPTEHKILASRNWPATPCTIVSSRVQSHDSDDGTTYSIDIVYTYKVNGQTYTSPRYNFVGGSSSGFAGKKKVVDQYRPRSKATCYVNPADPNEAVLSPGWSADALFPLLPLLFLLVGAGGLIGINIAQRKKRSNENIWAIQHPGVETSTAHSQMAPIQRSVTLKPAAGPGKKFIGILIFALFWNGFIALAFHAWRSQGSAIELCTALFALPFVAVGIGLLIAVIYSALALLNPRGELELSPSILSLGGKANVRWQIRGRTDRISKLTIRIEGREEATYQRGTRTTTDRNIFQIIDVTETTSSMQIARGEASFQIPADTMHSFEATHNKIIWEIKLRGEIANWPDLISEYRLQIQPMEPGT